MCGWLDSDFGICFTPQVTVKLSEMQVCSCSGCTSPCLYLQLFSPLSANILLTMLHTEEAAQVNKSHKEMCSFLAIFII